MTDRNVDWKAILEERLAASRQDRRDETQSRQPDPGPEVTKEVLDRLLDASRSGQLNNNNAGRAAPAGSRPSSPAGPGLPAPAMPRPRPRPGARRPASGRLQPIAYIPEHHSWDGQAHRHGHRRISLHRLQRLAFWVLMLIILAAGIVLTFSPDLLPWARQKPEVGSGLLHSTPPPALPDEPRSGRSAPDKRPEKSSDSGKGSSSSSDTSDTSDRPTEVRSPEVSPAAPREAEPKATPSPDRGKDADIAKPAAEDAKPEPPRRQEEFRLPELPIFLPPARRDDPGGAWKLTPPQPPAPPAPSPELIPPEIGGA